MNKILFLSLALIVLGGAIISAQDADADDDSYLDFGTTAEELVITAGRTAESSKNVPAQVTVITADDIERSGAASLPEALETIAGLRFFGGMAGNGSEQISMRGFGENSFGRVLILIDGNKANAPDMTVTNWNAIPLANIERIEVLDGSASVLYGNNAVGGVINIITKQGGKRRTSAQAAFGSFLYNREALSHFQPLYRSTSGDNAKRPLGNFFITAEHSGTQAYRERQGADTINLFGSTTLYLSDAFKLSANAYFSRVFYKLPGGLPQDVYKDDPRKALNRNDQNTEYHYGGGLSLAWHYSDLDSFMENIELQLPLSYRGKSIFSDMASFFNTITNNNGSYTDRTIHTAEARPQASLTFNINDIPLRLLGGVDLYYTGLDADRYGDSGRTFPTNTYAISNWNLGPYITAQVSPLSNLTFSVGGRFDTAIVKAENKDGSADGEKTWNAFVYDAGLVYNLSLQEGANNLKLYARYSSLFRYPFVDELAQVSGFSDRFNANLKPEKGFNAEIGTSWEWRNSAQLNANFFYMRIKDEIAVDYIPPDFDAVNINLDKTQRLGTNISFSLTPLKVIVKEKNALGELIIIEGAYSFVNAVFVDGINKDKKVPLVPQHTVYGSVLFKLPFGLSIGPDFKYASDCYYSTDNANAFDIRDAYFLWGARARYEHHWKNHKLAFQLTAKNLLDTRYVTFGFPGYVYPEPGRSFIVSVHYKF